MSSKPLNLIEKILPFIIFGVAIAIAVALFFLLFYVVAWGIVIGLVIYAVSYVRQFFQSKHDHKVTETREGRIIEHDDKQ